jgi:hypothetical protein
MVANSETTDASASLIDLLGHLSGEFDHLESFLE